MPFLAWTPPSLNWLRLRAVDRHIAAMVAQHAREQNRLHAAQSSRTVPDCEFQDLKRPLASLRPALSRFWANWRCCLRT
jgi:hypothetical protein